MASVAGHPFQLLAIGLFERVVYLWPLSWLRGYCTPSEVVAYVCGPGSGVVFAPSGQLRWSGIQTVSGPLLPGTVWLWFASMPECLWLHIFFRSLGCTWEVCLAFSCLGWSLLFCEAGVGCRGMGSAVGSLFIHGWSVWVSSWTSLLSGGVLAQLLVLGYSFLASRCAGEALALGMVSFVPAVEHSLLRVVFPIGCWFSFCGLSLPVDSLGCFVPVLWGKCSLGVLGIGTCGVRHWSHPLGLL